MVSDRFAALADFAQQQVAAGYPAISMAVIDRGDLVLHEAWGWAQTHATGVAGDGTVTPAIALAASERTPVGIDTVFDLASNTKIYATTYAVQRLVSEGRLDLDRTIASFPGWSGFSDERSVYTGEWTIGRGVSDAHSGKHRITVRDLLAHTGGLLPDPRYHDHATAGELFSHTSDPDERTGIIDAICRTPLAHPPGESFVYSDVGFMILGLLVEQITGSRLDAYLDEGFFGPLRLTGTGFRPLQRGIDPGRIAATELNGNTRDGNVSFGVLPEGRPVPIRRHTLCGEVHDEKAHHSMGGVSGHAGLFSTAAEVAVLAQLMLDRGVRDGRRYFDGAVAEHFASGGLGWRRGARGYGHRGWTGTLTLIDPDREIVVVALTNRIHAAVTAPPNGFATDALPAARLDPLIDLVYAAMT